MGMMKRLYEAIKDENKQTLYTRDTDGSIIPLKTMNTSGALKVLIATEEQLLIEDLKENSKYGRILYD